MNADSSRSSMSRRSFTRLALCGVAAGAAWRPGQARAAPKLEELPPGARIGTGSPRRIGQLLARRRDLRFEAIRGNVDTRLRKLSCGSQPPKGASRRAMQTGLLGKRIMEFEK